MKKLKIGLVSLLTTISIGGGAVEISDAGLKTLRDDLSSRVETLDEKEALVLYKLKDKYIGVFNIMPNGIEKSEGKYIEHRTELLKNRTENGVITTPDKQHLVKLYLLEEIGEKKIFKNIKGSLVDTLLGE